MCACLGMHGTQVLEVSHNMISGILPVELAQITSLVSLDISQNNLYGELPEQFAQARACARAHRACAHWWMDVAWLTGGWMLLGLQLVNLVFFKASRNNFGGKLPSMLYPPLTRPRAYCTH